MKVYDSNSPEIIEFKRSLDEATEMIKLAFSKRTAHLNGEKYLTTKLLSKLLHMSERLLQDYRDSGKIPYVKISGKIYYRESDIIKLLEENYHEAFNPV